jgi:4-aminobutyrate aminotransferase-like enzyme
MITAQMDCFNAIHNVLTGNDNGDVVDNYKNQAKRLDAEAQVVNYNVQQTSNAAMKDPYQVM